MASLRAVLISTILGSCFIAVAGAASQAPPAQRGISIREIQVTKLQGSSVLEVEIIGNGAFEYRTTELSNPQRLVVDLPSVLDKIRQKELAVNSGPLRAVRVGQLSRRPLVSRVVMDLDSKTPFQIRRQPNGLVVTIGQAPAQKNEGARPAPAAVADVSVAATPLAGGSPHPSPEALPKPDPQPAPKSDVQEAPKSETAANVSKPEIPALNPEPASRKATEAEVAPQASPALLSPTSPGKPAPTGARLQETKKTAKSTTALAETSTRTPVRKAALMPAVSLAPTTSEAKSSTAIPAQKTEAAPATNATAPVSPAAANKPTASESRVLLAQAAPATPPTTSVQADQPAPQSPYTGEPISVNLKDVDLKDFFRLIHEISGLNVVLDPNVSGTVTVVLDEIPWDQAMEIVMRNNALGAQREGSVVRIARLSTLEAEQKQQRDLAVAAELAQPLQPQTRTLNYANAVQLIPVLKRLLSSRGDLTADARTNTLIIRDVPAIVANFDRLLGVLDRKAQQVEIEARVVSASRSFARDIGVQLAAAGLTGNVTLGGTGQVGPSPVARATPTPLSGSTGTTGNTSNVPVIGGSLPLVSNLPAQGPTSGFTFLLTAGNSFALDAIITAAESKGIGKLLSRPKIITQDNTEATVKQGVRIPIQTTINNTISVQYVDVVLRLTVTPHVTPEGTIFLKTDIENSSIDPGIATTPGQFGLDTQAATTSVLVSNGGTVFFGGVIQNINRISQTEVPLLGSVPLVGNLFKHKATSSSTNELLFFITPKLVQS